MGAHPSAPSRLVAREGEGDGERSLLELIASESEPVLGERVLSRFGPRLPFLLKVLAAETPLSLQAHPTLEQARAGYAAEEAQGVPHDAGHRNYKDPNHKPELICALDVFHALVGFRRVTDSVRLLSKLNVDALAPLLEILTTTPDESGLRRFFEALMGSAPELQSELSQATHRACSARAGEQGEFKDEYGWGSRIGELYPGDVGIVVALCLNLLKLEPGDAVYLPAGNLHAYLQGTGVEIMANSDNVLRGGLTPKHVDVPELLRVLDFSAGPVQPLRARSEGAEQVFHTEAPEFRLSYVDVAGPLTLARRGGPEILLVTQGSVRVRAGGQELDVPRGGSAFIRAADPDYELTGEGRVFRATVGS